MADIDVDSEQLKNFIDILDQFQQDIHSRMMGVETAWDKVRESWKGSTSQQFTKDYEQMAATVGSAQKSGDEALDWLRRYYEIIQEFENL